MGEVALRLVLAPTHERHGRHRECGVKRWRTRAGVVIGWLVRACYRPRIVRVMLLPCHIGMCIPSAGTALGIYASKLWAVTASMLIGH